MQRLRTSQEADDSINLRLSGNLDSRFPSESETQRLERRDSLKRSSWWALKRTHLQNVDDSQKWRKHKTGRLKVRHSGSSCLVLIVTDIESLDIRIDSRTGELKTTDTQ
jgi:hypothetical protein